MTKTSFKHLTVLEFAKLFPGVDRDAFRAMFEEQINDANTASVVSGAKGIPICFLTSGTKQFSGRTVQVNQSQLDKQQPNIRDFVARIE